MKILWALIWLGMVSGALGQGFSLRDGAFVQRIPTPVTGYQPDRWYWLVTTTSNNSPFAINFTGSGTRQVEWGDGRTTNHTGTASVTNIYATTGNKILTIREVSGSTTAIAVSALSGNRPRLKQILSPANGMANLRILDSAFTSCSGLTAAGIPKYALAGLTNVTSLYATWSFCSGVRTFPEVNNLTNVTSLGVTWGTCSQGRLFPEVNNLTSVTNLGSTWYGCSAGTNFPAVSNLTRVTSMIQTWMSCSSNTIFPEVNTLVSNTSLAYTWYRCSAATNFPAVSNMTSVTNLYCSWQFCSNATSFPAVATMTNVYDLSATWGYCVNATNFPAVSNLTRVTTLAGTWTGCSNSIAFPDVGQLTNVSTLQNTWEGCSKMTAAPTIPPLAALSSSTRAFYNCWGITNALPQLWITNDYPMAQSLGTHANCFTDCTNASNWAAVPLNWR